MFDELMVGAAGGSMALSHLTLAVFQDTGVYFANWSAAETIPANRDATPPRVAATAKGTVTLWFEGPPWSGARLLANGRAVESPGR